MKNNLDNSIQLAFDEIKAGKNIYIASHVNPDGDNIGSILALGLAIKKALANCYIIKTDDIPSYLDFLPNIEMIREYELDESIDLFIALDCSDEERLGKYKAVISKAKTVINIDHHKSNTYFGDINIVDPEASATGELIYKFIKEIGVELDKDIATCIYTAISSDTGSFMYESTSAETHEIVADLLNYGIDHNDININLYQNRSIEKTLLLVESLKSMNFYFDKKVALVKVTQDMLSEANARMEDTEGIVSFIKEISPVEVAILLKEHSENEIKVSMRSKRDVDVAEICSKFGGGGHVRAAGATINDGIMEAEKLIIESLKNIFR